MPERRSRSLLEYLQLFFCGIAMGSVDVIPGVSGGTMAFILGIYEELLDAIKSFDMHLVRLLLRARIREALEHVPWQFLVVLLSGIGLAVVTLAHAISWLLEHEREYLYALFFGLILASIVAIGATVRWSLTTGGMLVIGTAIALIVVNLVPLAMPHDPLTLFLSGMAAIVAMILPGISGSFILLILGQYDHVLRAVKTFDFLTLVAVGLGAVVGIISFARVLSWLLKRYHQATVAALVGFMLGSLWKIWPWKEVVSSRLDHHGRVIPLVERNIGPVFTSGGFWIALVLCLIGFLVVCLVDHLQSRSNPVMRMFWRM